MYEISLKKGSRNFEVKDLTTGKIYECKFCFHKGHGDFHEFYIDVSNVPGAKLKKWLTLKQKFVKSEKTGKFEPNVYEMKFLDNLQGGRNVYDLEQLF